MKLKYGMNPNQEYAEFVDNDNLKVLNGNPSVINFLDALNSWQLVKEIDEYSNISVAASFKHVTPSGVSIGNNVEEDEKKSYCYKRELNSDLSKAYLKARGVDRLASFGDFIALSRKVDIETAKMIRPEVSDGIIAPDFDDEALEILMKKKKGNYVIFKIKKDHVPTDIEERTIFGFKIKQQRNNLIINDSCLNNIVTDNENVHDQIIELEREKVFADKIMLNELDLCLCSDGFYPQVDNIELAHKYGVKYIAAPMGSIRDNDIIDMCNKYGIVFINTGVRLFHH